MTLQADPNRPVVAYRPRIVLADDHNELRELLALRLRARGYDVHEASNGHELFEALRRKPDLIISDLQMPGLSGIQVLERLRETDWTVPFILMTGFPDATTHELANGLGTAYVFHKPLDLTHLVSTVEEIIGSPA